MCLGKETCEASNVNTNNCIAFSHGRRCHFVKHCWQVSNLQGPRGSLSQQAGFQSLLLTMSV